MDFPSKSQSIAEGNQSRNLSKNLKSKLWRNELTGSFTGSCLAIEAMTPPKVGLDPLEISTDNQDSLSQTCPQAHLIWTVPQLTLLSSVIPGCV